MPQTPTPSVLDHAHARVIDWFDEHARDLPWRHPEASPWAVMVSEFMLQQTPVVRVLPVWTEWMQCWPTPADLAAVPASEVLRAWGRLGYPRRALRLHAAAQRIVADHDGEVPATAAELLSLPGVGEYTSAAIACFAFGVPEVVVDTNIRRVHARAFSGRALPEKSLTRAEMTLAAELMPAEPQRGCRWNAATMELGALVCTARSPQCQVCPLADSCAWLAAGSPEAHYQPKGQAWVGTDRQLRGAIMAVLREHDAGVPVAELQQRVAETGRLSHAPDGEQWDRCQAGLVRDGLAELEQGQLRLPS
ncbi:MAG: A/G-specific adenine glycosylase [Micrococcaceae bacterium]